MQPPNDLELSPTQVLLKHPMTLWLLAAFWTGFLLFDFSGDLIRAINRGFALEAISNGLPQLVFVYFAWFCLSALIGLWANRWPVGPSHPFSHAGVHIALALAVALFHLLWITLSYWVFLPSFVANVQVTAVFMEQFFKWFHFELAIYVLILCLWTIVLVRRTSPSAPTDPITRLIVRDQEEQRVIPVAEIRWLEADGNYVRVHTKQPPLLMRTSLRQLETQLDPKDFLRANRGIMVNATFVSHINNGTLYLTDGTQLPISRRRKTALRQRLGDHSSPETNH